MQHERIGVSTEFSDDERHALRHQAGHEGDIARQAVQLGNDHAALRGFGCGQGGGELRPAIERVGAFAGLGFDELPDQDHALGFGEVLDGRPLGFNSETRTLLPEGRDSQVGNRFFHNNCIPPFAVCMNSEVEQ